MDRAALAGDYLSCKCRECGRNYPVPADGPSIATLTRRNVNRCGDCHSKTGISTQELLQWALEEICNLQSRCDDQLGISPQINGLAILIEDHLDITAVDR